jgi:hydrogenase maturation protease
MIPAFLVRCTCWKWNLSTEPAARETKSEWKIAGLGTLLGGDDEIGLALVRALSRDAGFAAHCVILESADAATVASLLLEWNEPVVLVDAVDMNLDPGDCRFFSDKDASVILKTGSVSTHGLGLAEGLELARALGFDPSVFIFGVQPFSLSPGQGLTPEMAARFPSLLEALKNACAGSLA